MSWTLKANDTFTDSALLGIASHNADSGATGPSWGDFNSNVRIDINGTAINAFGTGLARNLTTLANKQACEIALTVQQIGAGVCGDSSGNGYAYIIRDGLSSFLQRFDAGSPTNLATGGPSASVNDVARLEVDGAGNLTCYLNGVANLTASDSTYGTGHAWVNVGTGSKGDNFNAYEDAGAGATFLAARPVILGQAVPAATY